MQRKLSTFCSQLVSSLPQGRARLGLCLLEVKLWYPSVPRCLSQSNSQAVLQVGLFQDSHCSWWVGTDRWICHSHPV